jgi:ACS family tartrate transporter-like MFS transporter
MHEMSEANIAAPLTETLLEQRAVRRVIRRIVPFLVILFIFNFLDRTNVGFAALTMNGDIGIKPSIYGLGAGIFFIGYFIFEVPSNVMLHKFGPRIWIARIMITWGAISSLTGFLHTPGQFVGLRLLLGVAEAGFFPGIIFLLGQWIPRRHLAGTIATFYLGAPISQVIGAPLSTALMAYGAKIGFAGWRLMYICEGNPAILLGLASQH